MSVPLVPGPYIKIACEYWLTFLTQIRVNHGLSWTGGWSSLSDHMTAYMTTYIHDHVHLSLIQVLNNNARFQAVCSRLVSFRSASFVVKTVLILSTIFGVHTMNYLVSFILRTRSIFAATKKERKKSPPLSQKTSREDLRASR